MPRFSEAGVEANRAHNGRCWAASLCVEEEEKRLAKCSGMAYGCKSTEAIPNRAHFVMCVGVGAELAMEW